MGVVYAADYDGRGPLAASEGRMDAVRLLPSLGAAPAGRDRWGYTHMEDAQRAGRADILDTLLAIVSGD